MPLILAVEDDSPAMRKRVFLASAGATGWLVKPCKHRRPAEAMRKLIR